MIWSKFVIHFCAIGALVLVFTSTSALSQVEEIKRPRRQVIPAEPVMRLEDLEAMANQRNPTLIQANTAIRAAEGRRKQAGLFPNPVAGYFVEEFAFRSPGETAEQGAKVGSKSASTFPFLIETRAGLPRRKQNSKSPNASFSACS